MKTILQFLKNSGIFFVGNILSKVIVFLMLPLYTNYISTENYGYFDLSVTYVTLLTSFLYFDIWAALLRFLYDYQNESEKNNVKVICWRNFCVSSVIFAVVGVAFCVGKEVRYGGMIVLYGISVNIQTMCSFSARGVQKNIQFAVSGIINTIVTVGGNLVMILLLKMDVEALYISAIMGNLIQSCWLCVFASIFPDLKAYTPNQSLTRQITMYSLPLGINSVSYWLLTGYNRVALENIMGLSANGIYAIGNKFGTALNLVTTCFTYAWQDIAFGKKQDNEEGRFYGKAICMYYSFLCVGVSILLPCFSLVFPLLIGKSFSEAYSTIPVFLVMAVLSAVSTFVGNIFYAIKDTHTLFSTMMISCACNLVMCRPMIELWGINGANLSVCIGFLVSIFIRCIVLCKKIKLEVVLFPILTATVLMLSMVYAYYLNRPALNITVVIIIFGVLITFVWRIWKRRKTAGQ